jgi:hypothetical protein
MRSSAARNRRTLDIEAMLRLRDRAIDRVARVLTKPRRQYQLRHPNNVAHLRAAVQTGDVVLIDGDQRVSEVIKYLTQSSWSHAALYVGDELLRRFPDRRAALVDQYGLEAEHMIVEALMEGGVIASPLVKYAELNLRICRPRGLRAEDLARIIDEVLPQLGSGYDVHRLLELARYFFPLSLIPRRLRRTALAVAGGLTTDVICSSMIARAFQNVGFPILPAVERVADVAPSWQDWLRRRKAPYPVLFHRQREALITPRDFDLSPYFDIVKFNAVELAQFDYRRVRWA